jgi:hypothetical protein
MTRAEIREHVGPARLCRRRTFGTGDTRRGRGSGGWRR